jgi:hypothetical protein
MERCIVVKAVLRIPAAPVMIRGSKPSDAKATTTNYVDAIISI